MSILTRRQFLASSSLAAAGAALAGCPTPTVADPAVAAPAVADPVKLVKIKTGIDQMTLGKSGIKTTVLGLGTGTRGGREQRDLGTEAFVRLVREAYDRGIRYIDTADMYKTHPLVKAALKELPRGEMFVQTKLWARNAETAKSDLERIRKELGMETLDTLLIHCMDKNSWNVDLRPVMDVYLKAKEKGQIRALGVSCHTLGALETAADTPEMDVHLVRINPFEKKMDGAPKEVSAQIAKMHADNRGVIGMKIYGEGTIATREERVESLKYVIGLGTIHAFTIGFSKIEQIDDTLKMIEEATAS